MMFKAAPGSPKPKRRIDQQPEHWQQVRDDLHALALEHGPAWLELAERANVCPDGIGGRDYELWQPLLAIAAWIEAAGEPGLLGLMQRHALWCIEQGADDQTPEAAEVLLRTLAAMVSTLPTPRELLNRVRDLEPELFGQFSPKGVANQLKRYGVCTTKANGRRIYRVSVARFRQIEQTYNMDLNLPGEPGREAGADTCPTSPIDPTDLLPV